MFDERNRKVRGKDSQVAVSEINETHDTKHE
jgi:hypothetical protein